MSSYGFLATVRRRPYRPRQSSGDDVFKTLCDIVSPALATDRVAYSRVLGLQGIYPLDPLYGLTVE